jgi:hypothetical protein
LAGQKQLYLEVTGDTVLESGIIRVNQQIDKYTKRIQSETTVGYYEYLVLPNKILVLYSGKPSPSCRRIGALTSLPSDVRKELVEASGMDNDDWLLPFLLDTSSFGTGARISLAVMAPVALFSFLTLSLGVRRSLSPAKHPLYKAAEEEKLWLQQHHGTDLGNQVSTCDRCGCHKKVVHSSYRKNVSYLVQRQEMTADGNYCPSCNYKIFWRFTLTTIVGTWWGMIGAFLGPIYIVQNLYNYSRALWRFHAGT